MNKEGLKGDRKRLNDWKLNRKEKIRRKERKEKREKERETNRKENERKQNGNRQIRPKRNILLSEVLIRNKHVSIHLPQCELNKCRL